MIGLKTNNGVWLDLSKVSITFELLSPIFNTIGSFSYPFTLPATAKNKRALGFPNRINVMYPVANTVSISIYIKGGFWKSGNLTIKTANNDSIKAYFAVDAGYFYSAIKNLNLQDIDLEGNRTVAENSGAGQNDMFSRAYEDGYPNVDFAVFPVKNENFYIDTFYDDNFDTFFDRYLNHYHQELKLNISGNTIVPFVYTAYVLKRLLLQLGYFIDRDEFYQNEDLRKLVICNNVACGTFEPDPLGNVKMTVKDPFNLSDHLPDTNCSTFIQSLESNFGAFIFADDTKKKVVIRLLTNILDDVDVNTLDGDIVLISGLDYSKTKSGYKVQYDNDSNDDIFDSAIDNLDKYTFKGSVQFTNDLPATADLNDVYYVEAPTPQFLVWTQRDVTSVEFWNHLGGAYSTIINGEGEFSIVLKSSYVPLTAEWIYYKWYTPVSIQNGNFILQGVEYSEFSLKYLFYRGMQENGNSELYPFATPSIYDFNRNKIGNVSLGWHGEYGLYENFWKKPLQFHQSKTPIDFKASLSVTKLANIKFHKKYRFLSANWLISKVKFTVTNDTISPAKITAWKV